MSKRIDRRLSDELVFDENQFNIAFEFIKYGDGRFELFDVDPKLAVLKGEHKKEIMLEDGNEEETETVLEIIDCKILYPELINDNIMIGGSESKLFCFDPEQLKVQGREFFNTYQAVSIKIDHCKPDKDECGGVDLFDYW